MRRRNIVVMGALLILVAAVSLAAAQPNVSGAKKPSDQVQLDLIIELGTNSDGTPTSVTQIVEAVSKLGSGGFAVDSFFDITYEMDSTIEIEIIAMQLRATLDDPSNPAGALEEVISAVGTAGNVYYGHVTLIK